MAWRTRCAATAKFSAGIDRDQRTVLSELLTNPVSNRREPRARRQSLVLPTLTFMFLPNILVMQRIFVFVRLLDVPACRNGVGAHIHPQFLFVTGDYK
jgi:hypothetical protein